MKDSTILGICSTFNTDPGPGITRDPARDPVLAAGKRSRETASRMATKAWTDGDWEVKQSVVLSGKEYHHHFFFFTCSSYGDRYIYVE